MSCAFSEKKRIWQRIVFFALVSAVVSLGAAFYGVSVKNALLFSLYQTAGIFIPGVALFLLIQGRSDSSLLSFACLSYAFGYSLNILAYFITVLIGLGDLQARIVILILAICSVFFIFISKRNVRVLKIDGTDIPFLIVFLSFLVIVFLGYGGNYPIPESSKPDISYHADALYWVENAVALTKSFPPQELRMCGTPLFYHYFASVYVAFANLVTGIDCFSLSYSLYPLGKSLILFGGLYELAKSFFPERKKQIFFIAVLLFTTGFENYTIVNHVAHILTLPFGFDMGYAFGLYFLAFLLKQYVPVCEAIYAERKRRQGEMSEEIETIREYCVPGTEELSAGNMIAGTLCFLMCAGHKAPVAMILLVFAGVICLFWLLNKQPVKAILNGIPAVICFILIMMVCVGLFSGAESRVNPGSFSHVATLRATPLFERYEEAALNREPGISGIIRTGIVYLIQMMKLLLLIHPLILFLDFHGIIQLLKNKNADWMDIGLLLTVGAGLFMGLFNAQEGVSQLYYSLISFVPGLLFGARHMKVYLAYDNSEGRNIIAGVVSGLMLMQLILFMGCAGVLETSWKGFNNAAELRYHPEQNTDPKPYSLQRSDYEALVWLRENTPENSIVVSDRSVLCDLDNYMYYGTFSERKMYLEGDRYFYNTYVAERNRRREICRMIYANSFGDLLQAKEDGADYVIQTKWVSPYYLGMGCTKVFSTDTINIWQINREKI